MQDVAAFMTFVVITVFTPGPNTCMALAHAGRYGLRRGLSFCVGVFLGMLAVMLACAAGSAGLLAVLPQGVMAALGAVYMLWLAWRMLSWKGTTDVAASLSSGWGSSLCSGALLQLVNFKIMFYGLTAYSVFILPWRRDASLLAVFAVLLAFGGFASTCCWACCGAAMQGLFARHPRVVNAILALMLGLCAVSMVV